MHRQRALSFLGVEEGSLPETERASRENLALPMWAGIDPEIQERVGHSWASTTLDTYTHVMPVDELSERTLLAVLDARGEVLVRS